MMVDNNTNSILERIANALERLAPPEKKINNLDQSEGFIFETKSGSETFKSPINSSKYPTQEPRKESHN